MRILVTGASGFVGSHFLAARAGQDNVVALSRGGASSPAGNAIAGPPDLADIGEWSGWPQDIDAVLHLAALNPDRHDPASGDLAALRRANVEGTAALAKRAAAEGVRRIVFVSSANVHAPSRGSAINETDPVAPANAYARSKQEAEAAFWEGIAGSATQGCVLRPAPVFGRGGRGNVANLVRLAHLPLPLPLKGLGGPRSLLSVESLVEVAALALSSPAAAGETFLVADEGPLTLAGIVAAIRRGLGRPERLFPAPLGFLSLGARMAGKTAVRESLARSAVLDTSRLTNRLGWHPVIDACQRLEALAASADR